MNTLHPKRIVRQQGSAMLIAVIFFLVISLVIIFGVITPVVNQVLVGREKIQGKQSFYIAQTAVDDVIYRLNNSKTLSSTETITLNGNTATNTIADVVSGKNITTIASVTNDIKKIYTTLGKG